VISAFKDKYHKSQASCLIESLVRDLSTKGFPYQLKSPIRDWSISVVEDGWRSKPDMLSGKFSSRPHKLTVALYCIAVASKKVLDRSDDQQLLSFLLMLYATLIREVEVNGNLYGLTRVDYFVISAGNDLAFPIIEAIDQVTGNSTPYDISPEKPSRKEGNIDYSIPAFIRNKSK
jgi:hypothetical protein